MYGQIQSRSHGIDKLRGHVGQNKSSFLCLFFGHSSQSSREEYFYENISV